MAAARHSHSTGPGKGTWEAITRGIHANTLSRQSGAMGWGGGGIRKKGGRGGAHVIYNANVYQQKGATLSLNSAVAEYGVSREDLADVPCTWRSCHGNSYPLFQRTDVIAAVAKKKASDPAYASAQQTKAEEKELATAKAVLQEATAKMNEIEARISNGGYLGLTGTNPNSAERYAKTDAKRLYCLDDADLRGLSVTYGRGMMGNASENYLATELLRVAEAKHGGAAGFLERRRKQQSRTSKKELEEWKGKRASAQATVARLAQQPAGGGASTSGSSSSTAASAASSSKAPLPKTSEPRSAAGAGKAPASSTPTTATDAPPKKSAFAVLMKTSE